MANPWITLGGALGGGLDQYRWLSELGLRRQAEGSDEHYRMLMAQNDADRTGMQRERYARDDEERAQARQEANDLKRQQRFEQGVIPNYAPGSPVAESDVPDFQKYNAALIAQNPTTDPNVSTGYTFLGTPAQRRQRDAWDALVKSDARFAKYAGAHEAGVPDSTIAIWAKQDEALTPEETARRAGLIARAEAEAREGVTKAGERAKLDTTKRQAEVWKQNQLAALEKQFRTPQKDDGGNPIPGTYGLSRDQLAAEKLRIQNGYLGMIGAPSDAELPESWNSAPADAKPAPPLPVRGQGAPGPDATAAQSVLKGKKPGYYTLSDNSKWVVNADGTITPGSAAAPSRPQVSTGQVVTLRGVGKVRVTAIHPDGTFDYDTVR